MKSWGIYITSKSFYTTPIWRNLFFPQFTGPDGHFLLFFIFLAFLFFPNFFQFSPFSPFFLLRPPFFRSFSCFPFFIFSPKDVFSFHCNKYTTDQKNTYFYSGHNMPSVFCFEKQVDLL